MKKPPSGADSEKRGVQRGQGAARGGAACIWIQNFADEISKKAVSPVNTAKSATVFDVICG